MADYQRILSYLYRYEKAEKKECSGFVKAEQKSGNLKLTVQIDDERLLQGMELQLCFYEKRGESWQVWQLDTLITQEHKEEMHLPYPATVLPAGFRIKGQSGVFLYYQDAFYYGSVWIGEEIPQEVLEPLRWHKVSNFKKDFQGEPENEKNNLGSEKTLSDAGDNVAAGDEGILPEVKDSMTAQTEEIIEENVEIKEILAEDIGLENKQKPESGVPESELETEAEPGESESELETEAEPGESESELETEAEPGVPESELDSEKIESSTKKDVETELKLKERLALELEQTEEASVDNFEKMWINSIKGKPSVDNIFNTAFYEGYRVSAADLAQLGEEAGELRSNQFLLKGYERYHHILAGKVRYAGDKRYCIGVPGIYENREKYMAEIYQFPVFLSLTENRMKTGSFGYWLHLLSEVQ